jgi:hypothetical protein
MSPDLLAELERRDRLAAAFDRMTEWERSRLMRFALRLLNHDAKALRLAELQEAGKITRRELLARM